MSERYKVYDNTKPCFITTTVVGWVDIFTRAEYKMILIDSLKYCQKEKGLIIYAYCIMSNHMHMVVQADTGTRCKRAPASVSSLRAFTTRASDLNPTNPTLPEIIRDFKKFTSKKIIQHITDSNESRKEWMLELFEKYASKIKRNKNFKIWKDGFHPKVIEKDNMLKQKINYIHQNPVKAMIVEKAEDYIFSSAQNYAGKEGVLDVELIW